MTGYEFVQEVKPVYVDRVGNLVDYPFIPLPYYSVTIRDTILALANGGQDTNTINAANWGAGYNFYPYKITVTLFDNTTFNLGLYNGLEVWVIETASGRILIRETMKDTPTLFGATYRLSKTFDFTVERVLVAESIDVIITNATGVALISIVSDLVGMAI